MEAVFLDRAWGAGVDLSGIVPSTHSECVWGVRAFEETFVYDLPHMLDRSQPPMSFPLRMLGTGLHDIGVEQL